MFCSLCSSTTYITCPADPKKTLGIKLPFLVMIIKNLKKYFTFEVQVRICLKNIHLTPYIFLFWHFVVTNPKYSLIVHLQYFYNEHTKRENYFNINIILTGPGWQECEKTIPCQQLSEHNTGEAFHMHNAYATWWWLESDSVQFVWFHTACLWDELHWDS